MTYVEMILFPWLKALSCTLELFQTKKKKDHKMSSDQQCKLTESHVSTVIPLSMSINYDCPMSFLCPLVAAHLIWCSNWRNPLWGTQPYLRSQSDNQQQRVYPRWTDHVSGLCKRPTQKRPREFCWSAKVEKEDLVLVNGKYNDLTCFANSNSEGTGRKRGFLANIWIF